MLLIAIAICLVIWPHFEHFVAGGIARRVSIGAKVTVLRRDNLAGLLAWHDYRHQPSRLPPYAHFLG
jgi:hypothetical protein